MIIQRIKYRKFFKYLFATMLLVLGGSTLLLFYVEISAIETSREWLELQEEKILQSETGFLSDEINLVISDLLFLKNQVTDLLNEEMEKDDVNKLWKQFSRERKIYDQIRFIDQYGFEKIRINLVDTGAYIVSEEDLQYKGDRYYFTDVSKLGPNHIFVSNFDLNVEGGEVEVPRKPMIRFATPIYNEHNQFRGVIIVNYLGMHIIEKFGELIEYSKGNLYLVNQEGYYLYSGQMYKDFAFMFDEYKMYSFAADFPEIWEHIRVSDGQIISDNGMFISKKVDFNENIIKSSIDSVVYKEDEWHIIAHIPKDSQEFLYMKPNNRKIILSMILNNKLSYISMILLSVFISLLIYQNRESYNRIRYLSEYDSMTGLLNRRAGLYSLQVLLRNYDERYGKIVLFYLDFDGLKQINDILGHSTGDEFLLKGVNIIKSAIRESDLFIRLGGDEFLLVFNHMDKELHQVVWKRIDNEIKQMNKDENQPYNISISKGFVEVSKEEKLSLSALMKRADEAMYNDKLKNKAERVVIKSQ